MFLNKGFVVAFWLQKGHLMARPLYKRAWQGRLLTASQAEKDFFGLPRPSPGRPFVKECPGWERNPIKLAAFPILRFRELLGYDTREKTSRIS